MPWFVHPSPRWPRHDHSARRGRPSGPLAGEREAGRTIDRHRREGPHGPGGGRARDLATVRMSMSGPGFWSRRSLITAAMAGPLLETILLSAFGLESALGIAPQATAPAPFDVFHD